MDNEQYMCIYMPLTKVLVHSANQQTKHLPMKVFLTKQPTSRSNSLHSAPCRSNRGTHLSTLRRLIQR